VPTIKSVRKGAKGGKTGQKRRPHRITIMASKGNDSEDNSGEGFVAIAECAFKRQTRPPKDHFEKLLEAIYPHHPYPIKHKLKNCVMMRKFMTLRAPSRGSKLEGNPGGKSAAPSPEGVKVMTILG
jgi:hypothetical protein